MKLKEAQNVIWQNRKYEPKSAIEAISHLLQETTKSLTAFKQNENETGQKELEEAFSCLMIAMKMLEINPEDTVYRQIERMQTDTSRVVHIYSDRVELSVDNERKGSWNIYSQEDILDAKKMAQELKCKIIFEDATQLTLKEGLNENKTK